MAVLNRVLNPGRATRGGGATPPRVLPVRYVVRWLTGRAAWVATIGLVVQGCEAPTSPPPLDDHRPDVREWVDGPALDALDRYGRFMLPSPDAPPPDGPTSARKGAELALAAVRGILHEATLPGTVSIVDFMEERHGGPIPWSQVGTSVPLAYLAESPFERPGDSFFVSVRRRFGSYHVVGLYAPQGQVGSVAVSSLADGFAVDERGLLISPSDLGGSSGTFRFQGVAGGIAYHYPLHPEEAVAAVGSTTGAIVVEVPRLLQVPRVWPQGALWRLVLDREVVFRMEDGTGPVWSSAVHVGTDPSGRWIWAVPGQTQPATMVYRVPVPEGGACQCEPVERDVEIQVREGVPVNLIQVRPPGS